MHGRLIGHTHALSRRGIQSRNRRARPTCHRSSISTLLRPTLRCGLGILQSHWICNTRRYYRLAQLNWSMDILLDTVLFWISLHELLAVY
jgi:hypothetical protein